MPRLFGKAGKAGKTQRPEQVDAGGGGRTSGANVLPGPPIIYGPQPMSVLLARTLHVATSLTSPAVAGRFRPQNEGAATSRGTDGGSPDLGPMQAFRGLAGHTARGARLGAQSGPSAQPGYPGTGSTVLAGLAAMSRPDVQPYGGLR